MMVSLLAAIHALCATPRLGIAQQRKAVAQELRRLDNQSEVDGCDVGLECLARLKGEAIAFVLGANAYNKVMRLCEQELTTVERLYAELDASGAADEASLGALVRARVAHGRAEEAAAALAPLICATASAPSPRALRTIGVALHACCEAGLVEPAERVWRACRDLGRVHAGPLGPVTYTLDGAHAAMLTMRASAGADLGSLQTLLQEMGALSLSLPDHGRRALQERDWTAAEAAALEETLRAAGLEERLPQLERTLAVLKPDALQAGVDGEICDWIRHQGFTVVGERRLALSEDDAREWLQVTCGT